MLRTGQLFSTSFDADSTSCLKIKIPQNQKKNSKNSEKKECHLVIV